MHTLYEVLVIQCQISHYPGGWEKRQRKYNSARAIQGVMGANGEGTANQIGVREG